MTLHRKMKVIFWLACIILAPLRAAAQPTDILLLGSDHFTQVYKPGNPHTDILAPARQREVAELAARIARFRPEIVLVERLPAENRRLDSLYRSFRQGRVVPDSLPDARSEVFQLAFRIAKGAGAEHVFGANAPGASSQGMLANGDNIRIYEDSTAALRRLVRDRSAALASGKLSFVDYIRFLNTPETYQKIHRLRYITPSRVMNGTFRDPDEMVDTAFIIARYIGAELTAIFKRRDYMIYSNILSYKLALKPRRIVLVIGAAHIGSLRSIIRDDPEFRLIQAVDYLK